MRLAGLASFVALALGCGGPQPRVLVVGLDGASPKVIEPMFRDGRLPNLRKLADRGAWGWLRTGVSPIASPVVWTTVATGKLPRKHGIRGFVRHDEAGNRLYEGSDRRGHAIWNILSTAGFRVGVINWWTTFPPEIVHGVVITDHLLPGVMQDMADLLGVGHTEAGNAAAFPAEWVARGRQLISAQAAPDEPANPFAGDTELPDRGLFPRLSTHHANDLATLRLAKAVDDEIAPDLLMLLFFGIDRTSHFLWRYVEPDFPYPERLAPRKEHVDAGRALLESYYEVADTMLGELLQRYDLRRDLVIVLSDHGFEPAVAVGMPFTGGHESPRSSLGVIFVAGDGVAAGSRVDGGTTLDVTPTILTWLGLPVGADMDGRALAGFFPGDDRFVSPPTPIATHDLAPIRRVEAERSGSEKVMEEELRSLGYIE